MTPTQQGVRLRAPLAGDSDRLFRWINDRELVVLNAPFRRVERSQHDAWFAGVLVGAPDRHFFIIERTLDQSVIGSCQLLNIHSLYRSAELQIRIGERDAQGRGHGTEAVRLLSAFGFRELGLHRIGLQVFVTNGRAIRAYEKAGFAQEGRLREAACIDGEYVDVVCMGILNSSS